MLGQTAHETLQQLQQLLQCYKHNTNKMSENYTNEPDICCVHRRLIAEIQGRRPKMA